MLLNSNGIVTMFVWNTQFKSCFKYMISIIIVKLWNNFTIYIYLKGKEYHLLLLRFSWVPSSIYFQYFSLTSLTILLFFNFSPYNYTSYNIFSSLLPFYLPSTLYINVTILPPLHLPFIFTLLLPFFSLPFNPYLAPKKCEYSLSLSLSLSL